MNHDPSPDEFPPTRPAMIAPTTVPTTTTSARNVIKVVG